MSTVRIRFVREYEVKDSQRPRYPVNHEMDVSEASAQHFIRRGVAVPVTGKPAPAAVPTTAALPLEPDAETAEPRKDKKAKK